jgi:HPt (histidine-containing phosphotransfer) domain-containing protein
MSKAHRQSQRGMGALDVEQLWDHLLSRQPDSIRYAYSTLDAQGQQAVMEHLHRMASEAGWQAEQRLSARAALQVLEAQARQA